ncbi:hypothetical protein [Nocardia sp. NPDC049149]|uniref:WXG100-like domain-containing protein n=1 Tax=Nocardia sp. NPDC049149 TaxID=3364315 RepID=UPI0037121B45
MVEIPGALQWLLEVVAGSEYPEGDAEGMRGVAGDWRTAAKELRAILADIDSAKEATRGAYPQGAGVEAMLADLDVYRSGDQSLELLAKDFDSLAESAESVGTEIEYAQLMVITSIALLALEIAIAWLFPPTAPATEALAIIGTRATVRWIAARLMNRIVQLLSKVLGKKLANFLVRHIAIDTVIGTGQDLGIQYYQKEAGHRKDINWQQVGITAIASAAGAGVASPIGEALGKRLGRSVDVDGRPTIKPWVSGAITGTVAGTAGSIGGFAGSIGAQLTIAAYQGDGKWDWGKAWDGLNIKDQFDWRMLTAGATNGAMSGANRAKADNFYQNRHPDWYRPSGPESPGGGPPPAHSPAGNPQGGSDNSPHTTNTGTSGSTSLGTGNGARGAGDGSTGVRPTNAASNGHGAADNSTNGRVAGAASAHVDDAGDSHVAGDLSSNGHGAGDNSTNVKVAGEVLAHGDDTPVHQTSGDGGSDSGARVAGEPPPGTNDVARAGDATTAENRAGAPAQPAHTPIAGLDASVRAEPAPSVHDASTAGDGSSVHAETGRPEQQAHPDSGGSTPLTDNPVPHADPLAVHDGNDNGAFSGDQPHSKPVQSAQLPATSLDQTASVGSTVDHQPRVGGADGIGPRHVVAGASEVPPTATPHTNAATPTAHVGEPRTGTEPRIASETRTGAETRGGAETRNSAPASATRTDATTRRPGDAESRAGAEPRAGAPEHRVATPERRATVDGSVARPARAGDEPVRVTGDGQAVRRRGAANPAGLADNVVLFPLHTGDLGGSTPVPRGTARTELGDNRFRPDTESPPHADQDRSAAMEGEPGGDHDVPADRPNEDAAPPIDDEWSHRDAADIERELKQKYGFEEIVGFDNPHVPVDVLREFARAIDEILTAHPEIDLRSLHIEPLAPNSRTGAPVFARAHYDVDPNDIYSYFTKRITLNSDFATNPERMAASKLNAENKHHSPPGAAARPVYATILHELGHALDFAGGMRARSQIEDVLLQHYAATRGHVDPDHYSVWKNELSGYSYHKHGDLNLPEALADAFLDVQLNGRHGELRPDGTMGKASEPATVLYDLLLRESTGDAESSQRPDDIIIGLPPTEEPGTTHAEKPLPRTESGDREAPNPRHHDAEGPPQEGGTPDSEHPAAKRPGDESKPVDPTTPPPDPAATDGSQQQGESTTRPKPPAPEPDPGRTEPEARGPEPQPQRQPQQRPNPGSLPRFAEPGETRPHFLDVDGEQVPLWLRAVGEKRWEVELRPQHEPVPNEPEPNQSAPEKEPSTKPAEPEAKPDKPSRLRKLWDLIRAGYEGLVPKYPSGSGVDSAGQSLLGHEAGVPLIKHTDHGDVLQTKFSPARILKEGATMWKNRELIPFLKHLTSRIPDQAGHYPVPKTRDGEEYRYWLDEADPELVRKELGVDLEDLRREAAEEDRRAKEKAAAEARSDESTMLPETPEPPRVHPDTSGVFRELMNELAGAADRRAELSEALRDQARELGIDLPKKVTVEDLRRAVRVLEYQQVRRIGALAGLVDAARRYNFENQRIPYGDHVNFFDADPMSRFLREVLLANDQGTTILDWEGVNNGGEPGRDWGDLSYSDQPGRDEGIPIYFENALRRDQLKDERAVWAQLLGVDLAALGEHGAETLVEQLHQIRNSAGDLADFRAEVDGFVRADSTVDELTGIVADVVLRGSIESDGGFVFPDVDGLGLIPGEPGQRPRLVVIDGRLEHEQVLADALANHPDLAEAVNTGLVDVVHRVAHVEPDGTVRVGETDPLQVRHIHEEVDGRTLKVTTVRDDDGQWRAIVDTEHDGAGVRPPERLTREEIDAQRRELGDRLDIPPGDRDSPERLRQLRHENAIRAAQIEAVIDYARTAWDIDDYHSHEDARWQLAHRLGIENEPMTPQRVAEALIDPKLGKARRLQAVEDMVAYAKLLQGTDAEKVLAARDRLAARLGVGERPGRFPKDLYPLKFTSDLAHRVPNTNAIDPKKLAQAIGKLARRPRERENLADALAEYYRTINELDPFDAVTRGDKAVDPRVVDIEFPVHDKAIDHLLEVVGDVDALTDALDGEGLLAAHDRDPDPDDRGASRDWARTVGVDLTDADATRWAKVYEVYRDGKIDKKERLTPAQLADVQATLRDEVSRRGADLDRMIELTDRAAAMDAAQPARRDDPGTRPPDDPPLATPRPRPDAPDSDSGGRQLPPGDTTQQSPDPRAGQAPPRHTGDDVDAARQLTDRLAAENADAVRQLELAREARQAAMRGLPVDEAGLTEDALDGTIESLATKTVRQTPGGNEMAEYQARVAVLEEAATAYNRAETKVAFLDDMVARAMEREALAEAGAHTLGVSDRIGVVDADPPRIVVVGWHTPGDVRAELAAAHPELAPILARPDIVVSHVEITYTPDGRITHVRTDFGPDGAGIRPTEPRAITDGTVERTDPIRQLVQSQQRIDADFAALQRRNAEQHRDSLQDIDALFDDLQRRLDERYDQAGEAIQRRVIEAWQSAERTEADFDAVRRRIAEQHDTAQQRTDADFDALQRRIAERDEAGRQQVEAGFDAVQRASDERYAEAQRALDQQIAAAWRQLDADTVAPLGDSDVAYQEARQRTEADFDELQQRIEERNAESLRQATARFDEVQRASDARYAEAQRVMQQRIDAAWQLVDDAVPPVRQQNTGQEGDVRVWPPTQPGESTGHRQESGGSDREDSESGTTDGTEDDGSGGVGAKPKPAPGQPGSGDTEGHAPPHRNSDEQNPPDSLPGEDGETTQKSSSATKPGDDEQGPPDGTAGDDGETTQKAPDNATRQQGDDAQEPQHRTDDDGAQDPPDSRSTEGDDGPGTAGQRPIWRSHIPHLPHDYDFDLPDIQLFPPVVPQPPVPPQPPTPPQPPVTPPQPPQPPVTSPPVTPPPHLPAPPQLPKPPRLPYPPNPPELPELPELPGLPELPDLPEVPGLPELPDLPEPPEPPELPDLPVPEPPELPAPPDCPAPPEPEKPERPDLPPPPDTQRPPGSPHLPDGSGSPDADKDGSASPATGSANPRQNGSPAPPIPPPIPPMVPPPGPARRSRAFPRASAHGNGFGGAAGNGHAGGTSIVVRSHSSFSEFADFDPATGMLRGLAVGIGTLGGVYGELGELPVVFYREGARLMVRAGDQVIDLDAPHVGAEWQRSDDRMTRFLLTVAGTVVCDVRYRSVMPDIDLGLLIRDVLADRDRRTRIFAG